MSLWLACSSSQANTLLLDEPTNHLDPASVDMLTDALVQFPGTMVFISHDPTFLMRVATRVVEIDEGQARDFIGDYEYYLWKRAQELESIKSTEEQASQAKPTHKHKQKSVEASNGQPAAKGPSRRELTKTVARLEKQIEKLEKEIAQLESQIKNRDVELAAPDTYQDYARWNTLHVEREEWAKESERLTHRWEALNNQLESQKAQIS